ncbi:LysR family transcriptional regulator [Acidithiobacillus marinus]|uniref:LysR family transcriptional regulator n=1 Tax=Acidithiobacillus marinus TaxID=187490 RepID=A0A2I1DM00_9PROT|nr:LysR family transcriptional regulator [Acidithiobacillus marinus]PKY10900.1 LysR family transcriptional regulator [Acidithiobacillus marinus]
MLHQRIDPVLLLVWAQAARHGNLHAAAESLFMTQPAVSHRLKNLQEIVGEALYQRTRHGITPTAMGMALLRIAEQIENALEDARTLCQDTEKMLRGSLSILASHSNAESLLPQAIARFQQLYPGVSLRLTATNSRAARAMRDQADLIFVEDDLTAPGHADWVQETLRETTIVLLAPENPRWLGLAAAALPLRSLAAESLVWREEGSGIRDHALQALKEAGIYPEIRYELSGLAAIRDAVRCGLGVSFVSALNDGSGQRPGLITLNTQPRIQHRLSVLYRREASHSSRAFLELLRQ